MVAAIIATAKDTVTEAVTEVEAEAELGATADQVAAPEASAKDQTQGRGGGSTSSALYGMRGLLGLECSHRNRASRLVPIGGAGLGYGGTRVMVHG